ncbi:MAG: CoA transferase, partial [Comamonadaceae bacterium]
MLAGIKVIELGQMLAGPYAGSIFADLGADVVKVERPDGGDDARRMGPAFVNGDSLAFHIFNRGKKSVALDMEDTADLAAFHALAAD